MNWHCDHHPNKNNEPTQRRVRRLRPDHARRDGYRENNEHTQGVSEDRDETTPGVTDTSRLRAAREYAGSVTTSGA